MKSAVLRFLWEWRGFFIFLVVMFLFRSAIADWNQVPSPSMNPGILTGDRLVVDKIAYDLRVPFTLIRIASWSDPQRGDIVTFPNPKDEDLYVKRVVAVAGDTVTLRSNQLTINGVTARYQPLSPSEVAKLDVPNRRAYNFHYETILGSKRIIMVRMGANRTRNSHFGPITVPPGSYLMMGDNRDTTVPPPRFAQDRIHRAKTDHRPCVCSRIFCGL